MLALTDPDTLKQNIFTDNETIIIKILSSEKIHRQRMLKEYAAWQIFEQYFRYNKCLIQKWRMKIQLMLKITTNHDEIKETKDKAEKHDFEDILKSWKR